MLVPRGADLEHNMRQALILFMKEIIEKVEQIAEPFISKKKFNLDAYITFMEQPSHQGDELALHLLAVMNQIHYCIIKKTKVFYSHPTAFSRPSAMHITLVFLGNSIFRDTTTLSKKCPPPPHIEVFSGTLLHSPRSAHHHLTLISTNPSPKILHLKQHAIKSGGAEMTATRVPV